MRRCYPSSAVVVLVAAASLALSACSPSDEESADAGSTTATGSATSEPAATQSSASASEDASTTPAASDADTAACLIGTWEMDLSVASDAAAGLLGGLDVDLTPAGSARITFDETSATTAVDVTGTFSTDLGDAGAVETSMVVQGTASQAYSLTGSTVTWGAQLASNGTIAVEVTAAGSTESTEFPFADTYLNVENTTSEVSCDGDALSLTESMSGASTERPFTRVG